MKTKTQKKEKAKHTSGPWAAIIDNPLSVIPGHTIKAAHGVGLPVGIIHAHNGTDGPAEGIANAHLAAAAPELLDALQTLWAWVEDLGKSNPGYLGKLVLQDYAQMNEGFFKTEQVLRKLRK